MYIGNEMISSREFAVLGKICMSPARSETQKSPRSRSPGAIIDAVDGEVPDQTSIQALKTLPWYVLNLIRDTFTWRVADILCVCRFEVFFVEEFIKLKDW